MRIYAVADIHARAAGMERIRQEIFAHQPDVAGHCRRYHRLFHRAKIPAPLCRLPLLFIRGNTAARRLEHLAAGISMRDRMGDSWIVNCNTAGAGEGALVDMDGDLPPEIRTPESEAS